MRSGTETKLQPDEARLEKLNADVAAVKAVPVLLPSAMTVLFVFVRLGDAARFSRAFCMKSQPSSLAVAVAEPWSSASVPARM